MFYHHTYTRNIREAKPLQLKIIGICLINHVAITSSFISLLYPLI